MAGPKPKGKDAKSQAFASTDWRKREDTSSSAGATANGTSVNGKERLQGSRDVSRPAVQYRYPSGRTAPWETVVSAPAGRVPSSSSSSMCDNELLETATVRLRQVNPMVTSVNGEAVRLPNQYVFEVTPVPSNYSSRSAALGKLRRLNSPTSRHHTPSDDCESLEAKVREMILRHEDASNSVVPPSSEDRGRTRHAATAGPSSTKAESRHAPRDLSSDEEFRFQTLLSRLYKRPQPQRSVQAAGGKASARLIVDPAIIAMKVKEDAEVPGTSSGGRREEEAADNFFAGPTNHARGGRQPTSTDSGYASKDSGRSGSDGSGTATADSRNGHLHTRNDSSTDGSKTLNPTAAEFKSVLEADAVPCFSPRKLSRPPLTNIFPNAMAARPPVREAIAEESTSAVPVQPCVGLGNPALPEAFLPASQFGAHSSPGFGSLAGAFPGGLAPVPMAAASLGAFPSSVRTAFHAPAGVPPAGLAPLSGYHTYPPPAAAAAAQPTVPLFAPAQVAALPVAASAPLLGSGTRPVPRAHGKPPLPLPRPYFPVTKKPRDRDPVKQQLYEAYLEWRKAHEPGYHMSCKMRQAQRAGQAAAAAGVVAGWKEIAEKAKAAVGAAAKAAAAEKALRQESVREELRAKVKSLSRESCGEGAEKE
ncbi:hypothetical protein C8A03DRAFT_12130 [Achaetomium macrosporum]|uniref:Uncharacterized protein n=1 Tax=Achaetomium macrosporum TaxID=79813 RepID=A0AAN7HI93_9PEZI|nr:hypothetical protein C8A03DRAFT_12130 [Achaetomium macrosporum]